MSHEKFSSSSRNRARGFTLVELLVVIGIISVLVAILLPALTRARLQAQKIKCLSQLREITAQIVIYSSNHHGFLPPVSYPDPISPGNPITWLATLENERLPHAVTACPVQNYRLTDTWLRFGHYGANPHLMRKFPDPGYLKLSAVRRSSQKILIGDAGGYQFSDLVVVSPNGGWWYVPGTRPDVNPAALPSAVDTPLYDDFINGRHTQGVNLAFADGHASWVRSKVLYDLAVLDDHSWWVSTDSTARDAITEW